MNQSPSPMDRLSNELLRLILDQIEPDPDKTVPVDRRQFLSVESFDFPPPSTRGSLKDIGRFRLVCKRFGEIAAPLLFTRVAGRLSKKGLQRLEQLAEWRHLAQHVKKFSYLVPYFYGEGDQPVRDLIPGLEATFGRFNIARFTDKVREQRQIVENKEDVRVLKKTIASFTSLQHVQLLRVQDEEDSALLAYIRQHDESRGLIHFEWASACSHGSRTIGAALLASNNVPWSRFSSPMLSPQSAEFLNWHRPRSLSTLAERLTCLTLHFDDGNDLDQKMSELSGLFKTVFTTAKNMQAVHVGFPMHRPLNLPLEDVFHHVTWDRLVAFGVQGWKLDAREIIGLALRHRDRLKGLRLRDVLLREGSMWRDVLGELRDAMYRLDWVSLRRIGYAKHFDDQWMVAGAEVPDDPPPGESESESDSDVDDYDPMVGPSNSHQHNMNGEQMDHDHDDHDGVHDDHDHDHDQKHNQDHDHEHDHETSESESDSDDEHGPDAHEMDFPPLDSPNTPASAPWCNCAGSTHVDSREDLEDDGYWISNTKRKAWEKWVIRRCPSHGDR